jgi:hypothetical protein
MNQPTEPHWYEEHATRSHSITFKFPTSMAAVLTPHYFHFMRGLEIVCAKCPAFSKVTALLVHDKSKAAE